MTDDTNIPDLQAIKGVADQFVRFYAVVGACMSMAASVEHALFDCFVAVTGRSEAEAAVDFYRHVRFQHKRDTVDSAVRREPLLVQFLPAWQKIIVTSNDLLGPKGSRNLIGHNGLKNDLTFLPSIDASGMITVFHDLHVSQKSALVEAKLRPSRRQEFDALMTHAQQLITLRLQLAAWPHLIRQACGRLLPTDDAALGEILRRTHNKPREPS